MEHLLPIVPLSGPDRALLEAGGPGARVYSPVCALLAGLAGVRVRVYTTLASVAAELASGPFDVLLDASAGPCATQDQAVALALEAHLARGDFSPDAVVLALDCRNIGLTRQTLERAQAALREASGLRVASFEAVRDHPAQLFSPFRLVDFEVLAFLDAPGAVRKLPGLAGACGDARGCRVTRPFFFDWRGCDIWDQAPACYALKLTARNSAPALRRVADPLRALARGCAVFVFEGPFSARRLCPAAEARGRGQRAVPAYSSASALPVVFSRTAASGEVRCLCTGPDEPGQSLLRVWPWKDGRLGAREEAAAQAGPARAWTFAAPAGKGGADGFLACLLRPAQGEPYDYRLCRADTGLWAVDPRLDRPVSLDTGRPFCNRQELPALHVRDGALYLGRAAALLAGLAAAALPWRALALAGDEAVKVRDRLELCLGLEEQALAAACGAWPSVAPAMPAAAPASALAQTLSAALPDLAAIARAQARPAEGAAGIGRLRAALGLHAWKDEHLRTLSQLLPRCKEFDAFLDWALGSRHQLSTRTLADGLGRREAAATRPSTAPGVSAWPWALPGYRLSCRPHMLASDGARVLYVCARPDGGPQLLRRELDTGRETRFGAPDARYTGLWYDRDEARLCALFAAKGGLERCGVDFFSPQGEPLASGLLPRAVSEYPRVFRLQGAGASLFCSSLDCRVIFELDKAGLALKAVHDSWAIRQMQTFCCRDGALLVASFYSNVLTRQPLSGGRAHHLRSAATLFPTLVDWDAARGLALVVVREDYPSSREPVRHWLNVLDRQGRRRATLYLGRGFFTAAHVLEDAGELLLAEDGGQVLRFDLARPGEGA